MTLLPDFLPERGPVCGTRWHAHAALILGPTASHRKNRRCVRAIVWQGDCWGVVVGDRGMVNLYFEILKRCGAFEPGDPRLRHPRLIHF
jgi:hypothetical protein